MERTDVVVGGKQQRHGYNQCTTFGCAYDERVSHRHLHASKSPPSSSTNLAPPPSRLACLSLAHRPSPCFRPTPSLWSSSSQTTPSSTLRGEETPWDPGHVSPRLKSLRLVRVERCASWNVFRIARVVKRGEASARRRWTSLPSIRSTSREERAPSTSRPRGRSRNRTPNARSGRWTTCKSVADDGEHETDTKRESQHGITTLVPPRKPLQARHDAAQRRSSTSFALSRTCGSSEGDARYHLHQKTKRT